MATGKSVTFTVGNPWLQAAAEGPRATDAFAAVAAACIAGVGALANTQEVRSHVAKSVHCTVFSSLSTLWSADVVSAIIQRPKKGRPHALFRTLCHGCRMELAFCRRWQAGWSNLKQLSLRATADIATTGGRPLPGGAGGATGAGAQPQ